MEPQDPYGQSTLETLSEADNFNEWMFESIRPYCNGRILEIGSGIGNISKFFVRNGYTIMLSDFQESYCATLKQKFSDNTNVLGVISIDLVHPGFEKVYAPLIGTFDSLFTLNVIEHIENDALAVQNCCKLLKKGGSFVMLVPAGQWLFNGFDVQLGHFRRYNAKRVKALVSGNGFEVVRCWYFNFIGIAGWFVSGSILKKKQLPGGQLKLFNFLTPVFKLADVILLRKAGLSVIAAGRKI